MLVTDENRALVLTALYNAATPSGPWVQEHDFKPMTIEEAERLLGNYKTQDYFDYVNRRPLKVLLGRKGESVIVDFRLYDRDNGPGAGYAACKGLEVD
jgi:hypothetical protein